MAGMGQQSFKLEIKRLVCEGGGVKRHSDLEEELIKKPEVVSGQTL